MKAAVYTNYGGPEVLQIKEVANPTPKDNELLVRIHATAVNSGDWKVRKAEPAAVRLFFGLTKPRIPILGAVFAGEVVAVGNKVTLYKVGDKIYGSTGMGMGAYAEYKCLPESAVISLMPNKTSFAEAAVIPFGAMTAMDFLRKANIQPGQKVLVYGASGAVGTAAVQLARYFGAEVTGVCSTRNVALVKSLGADHVIDYTQQDFTENGVIYDVIFETVNKISFAKSKQSLRKNGILILGASSFSEMLLSLWVNLTGSVKVYTGLIAERTEDLAFFKTLVEKGAFKPVIDKTFPLEQIAAAHAYVEAGHKRGNVAIML